MNINSIIKNFNELKEENKRLNNEIEFLKKRLNMLFYKLNNKCFVSTDESESDYEECGCEKH